MKLKARKAITKRKRNMSITTPEQLRRRVQSDIPSDSMTEQHHAEEVEIHNIMKRYQKTGIMNHVSKFQPMYGDFINAPDFLEAQQKIAAAQSMFEELPSHVRDKFGNDPAAFLEFIQDPAQVEAIEEMGFSTEHLATATAEGEPAPEPEPEPAPAPAPEPEPAPA